jgi:mono/diheme cytochrome c family protein
VEMVSDATPTPPEYQTQIAQVLTGLFGTPDQPAAPPDTGLDLDKLRLAAGPAGTDASGASHGLYRQHCAQCHGITGDGRGPTGMFLYPYPRDYRAGVFKFKSTYNPAPPTDEDLLLVLKNGLPGTAMPSFALLSKSELEALVEYVKYLSIRGQMEKALINYAFYDLGEEEDVDADGEPILDDEGEPLVHLIPLDPASDPDQQAIVEEMLGEVVAPWQAVGEQVIVPEESAIPSQDRTPAEIEASVARGRELFYDTRGNCAKCHGPTALGDGQQDDFDIWNKAHKLFLDSLAGSTEEDLASTRSAVAASVYPVRNSFPRNLRDGVYCGGNRREDLFRRVHAGIAGTPMPGSGAPAPESEGTLSEEEIWSIVDYVLRLPQEATSFRK